MNKEELIQRVEAISNVNTQREELYSLLTDMNISFKRTRCSRCLQDYLNIAKEELNMIISAAEYSSFNTEDCTDYKYIRKQSVYWRKGKERILINQSTPVNIIKEFIKTHHGYFVCK